GLGGIAGLRLALAVLPGQLLVGLFRCRPGPLGPALRLPQGAAALAEGMKVIQLVADYLLLFLPKAFVDACQAVGQTCAAVAHQMLQGRELLEFLGPFFTVATGGQAAAQPALALRLNNHEDGLLPEEDLVGGPLACAGSGLLIQDL